MINILFGGAMGSIAMLDLVIASLMKPRHEAPLLSDALSVVQAC